MSGLPTQPALIISDLDGDGKNDVITPATHGIGIIRNIGYPGLVNFTSSIEFRTDSNVFNAASFPGVAAGDLDGDGKPDLVVANTNTNSISFFKNTSTPGLISFATKLDLIHVGGPTHPSIGDLDGDGKSDLAIINLAGNVNTLSVYRNVSINGNISFETLQSN